MTREEQIMKIGAQFAIDETDGQTSGRAASMRGILLFAFRAGAHWADQHPQWIPVEERLPKENQSVFICNARHDYGTALYQGGEWVITREYVAINVTHWMPIVPPRKQQD